MGAFSAVLAAVVLSQQGGGFSFEGIPVTAQTATPRAFVASGADPSIDQFEPASGDATLHVVNRLDVPNATYGDTGEFSARVRIGLDDFRIELLSVGAPPSTTASRQLPFAFPVSGGVRVGDVVFGHSGVGVPRVAPARSAASVFGYARIFHNGLEVDPAAPVEIFALATGVHADDDTHRRLPAARAGDTELWIYVPVIRSSLVPNGYLLAVFEDVSIDVAGRSIPAVAVVPTEEQQVLPGAIPYVANLAELPTLQPPRFDGLAADATVTRDNVPVDPTRPPRSVDPLNASVATPLPQSAPLLNVTTRSTGPQVGATEPATPLPSGITPLNAVPTSSGITTPTAGPTVEPLNAFGATPLVPTTTPGASAPAVTGPGITTVGTPVPDTATTGQGGTNPATGTTPTGSTLGTPTGVVAAPSAPTLTPPSGPMFQAGSAPAPAR